MSGSGTKRPGGSCPRCPRCGYDLSGTREARIEHCPECGWSPSAARKRLARIRRCLERADTIVVIVASVVVLLTILVSWLVLSGRQG